MLINWIERRLCKDASSPLDAAARHACGKAASLVGVGVNAALFLVKLGAGAISGSVAITADAINNLSDASSSVVSLMGFKLAGKPADEEHPYGHGRYEYLSALAVAVMILVIGLELLHSSVRRILAPEPVQVSLVSVAVLIISIALKVWLAAFNRRIGRRIGSKTLEASADDSRNDVITTSAVLAATLAAPFTDLALDGLFGAGVAVFILISGIGLVRDTLSQLLGGMPSKEELAAIREKILSYPGVLGAHDLMVHDYGPGHQFASVHVEMSAREDPLASHEVIDCIERDFLRDRGLHMVVHYDPVATDDPRVPALRAFVEGEAARIDPRLNIHDLRIASGAERVRVLFDCAAPYDLKLSDGEIARRLSEAVERDYPRYVCTITVDRGQEGA